MPFKSEKQRRYLWLKHPRIAKRWAHQYPESNKDLPMTADSKTANVLGSAGVGAGIGGLAGLGAGGLVGLLAPKGKRLRAALMGAGTLGPLGALSGGVMGASYAHDPRAFAQGIVPAVTAGAIGSGIGTYLASKKPKSKPTPADSKKKEAPGDDIKEAALSLTNLPIKQPSIDRAHSTTFRVEKAINKAKEEREKNEMSTAKSAGVTIPGVTTHEDAKQHAQNTGNYHATYRTADGKKNVYFKAEKKPVVAKKADAVEFGRLVKRSGAVSEYIGGLNPLNIYGGSHLGGLAALATKTRTLDQQASHDANDGILRAIGNVVVPGMGPYNMFKRMGSGIRSPEMKAMKARRKLDAIKREQDALAAASGETAPAPQAKAAGWKTETLGAFNPLSLFGGNHIGALAAAVTPTRTLNQQSLADDETWSNILIPGRGVYNQFKRIGAVQRSPEMRARQNAIKRKKLEQEAGVTEPVATEAQAPEEKAAYDFGRLVKRSTFDMSSPMVQGGLAGAGIGALGGGLAGLISPGEEEDENGNVRRKSRFGSALTGALGGAGLGGAVGAGMGYMAPGMTNQLTGAGKKMVGVPTTGLTDGEYQAGLPAADAPGDVVFG